MFQAPDYEGRHGIEFLRRLRVAFAVEGTAPTPLPVGLEALYRSLRGATQLHTRPEDAHVRTSHEGLGKGSQGNPIRPIRDYSKGSGTPVEIIISAPS